MEDKDDKITFVAPRKVSSKIKQLQEQLKLDSPGEVLSMALSMLELALGREVELKDKKGSYHISKFSKYHQTVEISEDGNS